MTSVSKKERKEGRKRGAEGEREERRKEGEKSIHKLAMMGMLTNPSTQEDCYKLQNILSYSHSTTLLPSNLKNQPDNRFWVFTTV